MPIDCVDLFSGVGGIALGLKQFTNPLLYCEWDHWCSDVLTERMSNGDIDPAPIHANIQNLHLPKTLKPPVMLSGGFPCQDISGIGLQRGVTEGSRSRMFFEIMRLVDETPAVQILFLENVSNILNIGMSEVLEALTSRGFRMQWIVRSANELGAPHVRARWFCLALRGDINICDHLNKDLLIPDTCASLHWREEPCPRVLMRHDTTSIDHRWSSRCAMLGNAVVPAVVREAFVELASASQGWLATASCLAPYTSLVSAWLTMEGNTRSFPEFAIVVEDRLVSLPARPPSSINKHTVDTSYEMNGAVYKPPHWPTPRRTVHASSLTARSIRDLPTLLVHSKASVDFMLRHGASVEHVKVKPQGICIPNINYIEWMMGYKKDWTKVYTHTRNSPPPQSQRPKEPNVSIAIQAEAQVQDDEALPTKRNNVNGMHMFMRDNPGNDIRTISMKWKSLSLEEREAYKEKARKARIEAR